MKFGEKLKKACGLWLYFFKISWFTFGGGWSIVAQMQKDFVDQRHEISNEELLDMVSVGRSLPGTMIGNVAYLYGYHVCGTLGGVLGVIGMVTPPIIILSAVTWFYSTFRDNVWVDKALCGVRSAVVPIVATAALKLRKAAFPYRICCAVCAAGCLLSVFWNVSCVLIVLAAAGLGILIGRWKGAEA